MRSVIFLIKLLCRPIYVAAENLIENLFVNPVSSKTEVTEFGSFMILIAVNSDKMWQMWHWLFSDKPVLEWVSPVSGHHYNIIEIAGCRADSDANKAVRGIGARNYGRTVQYNIRDRSCNHATIARSNSLNGRVWYAAVPATSTSSWIALTSPGPTLCQRSWYTTYLLLQRFGLYRP